MAALAIGLSISALLGAPGLPGHPISVWTAGVIAVALEVFCIAYVGAFPVRHLKSGNECCTRTLRPGLLAQLWPNWEKKSTIRWVSSENAQRSVILSSLTWAISAVR